MRRAPTYAEQKLWKALRQTDLHFRRQAPFGPYIVDFVCHSERLILEVDGGVHAIPAVAARDAEREAWLTDRGYRVIRVSSSEAASNPYVVTERILADLGPDTPTPGPSPQGGGECDRGF
jgi:very-short-patch-repair endonuclease